MARRRKRPTRRKTPNTWFIIFQILVLGALLVAIVQVTDSIADGTSAVVESFAEDDMTVDDGREVPDADTDFPGHRTDDGAERPPAVPVDAAPLQDSNHRDE